MCENPNLSSQIAHERETMFKEEKHGDTLDELGVGSSTANGEQNLITATNPTFPGGKKTALLRKLQTQLWKLRGLKDRSWREIVFMVAMADRYYLSGSCTLDNTTTSNCIG